MTKIEALLERIIARVNINLRKPEFDVGPYVRGVVPFEQYNKFYAFYGLTTTHPLLFHFSDSSLAGSYFLGKCIVKRSILYKTDVRGDELKEKGEIFRSQGFEIPLDDDEIIRIKDSYLIKTLVHSNSHDPENPEEFVIQNTISMPYANIHGSPAEGSFFGPFSTVDLTKSHNSVVGDYSYVQVGELIHSVVEPGRVWINIPNVCDFNYQYPRETLDRYVRSRVGRNPDGVFMDFVEARKEAFQPIYDTFYIGDVCDLPRGSHLSQYAMIKGSSIGDNVLIAQRAYVEDSYLGRGANAQENCYIINSRLEGNNVTAHGGKVINAHLDKMTFTGFNSFLRGGDGTPLKIGAESIVAPHTIIDLEEALEVPPRHLVWGLIRNKKDLATNSIALEALTRLNGDYELGAMRFQGDGGQFASAFKNRIEHILEANGAYFDGEQKIGHAQKKQHISFNTIQPYAVGEQIGIYPTINITP